MGRSLKKGPYVVERLLEKVVRTENTGNREPIKTWARACTIVPEFIGKNFAIHNGRNFIKLYVTEDMVGHKLGEFAPTRTFRRTWRQGGQGRQAQLVRLVGLTRESRICEATATTRGGRERPGSRTNRGYPYGHESPVRESLRASHAFLHCHSTDSPGPR